MSEPKAKKARLDDLVSPTGHASTDSTPGQGANSVSSTPESLTVRFGGGNTEDKSIRQFRDLLGEIKSVEDALKAYDDETAAAPSKSQRESKRKKLKRSFISLERTVDAVEAWFSRVDNTDITQPGQALANNHFRHGYAAEMHPFRQVRGFHVHVSGSDAGLRHAYDYARKHRKKWKHCTVNNVIDGPQREELPSVYAAHRCTDAIAVASVEGADRLDDDTTAGTSPTSGLRSTMSADHRDDAITIVNALLMNLYRNQVRGVVVEVERVVAAVAYDGSYSQLRGEISAHSLPVITIVDVPFVVGITLPFEMHIGIEARCSQPIDLQMLMHECTEAGMKLGGWSSYDKEHVTSYRCSSFLMEIHRSFLLNQYNIVKEIAQRESPGCQVFLTVEHVLGVWSSPFTSSVPTLEGICKRGPATSTDLAMWESYFFASHSDASSPRAVDLTGAAATSTASSSSPTTAAPGTGAAAGATNVDAKPVVNGTAAAANSATSATTVVSSGATIAAAPQQLEEDVKRFYICTNHFLGDLSHMIRSAMLTNFKFGVIRASCLRLLKFLRELEHYNPNVFDRVNAYVLPMDFKHRPDKECFIAQRGKSFVQGYAIVEGAANRRYSRLVGDDLQRLLDCATRTVDVFDPVAMEKMEARSNPSQVFVMLTSLPQMSSKAQLGNIEYLSAVQEYENRVSSLVAQYGGTMSGVLLEGFVCRFPDATLATHCAVSLARDMSKQSEHFILLDRADAATRYSSDGDYVVGGAIDRDTRAIQQLTLESEHIILITRSFHDALTSKVGSKSIKVEPFRIAHDLDGHKLLYHGVDWQAVLNPRLTAG